MSENLLILGTIHNSLHHTDTALSFLREALVSARSRNEKSRQAKILKVTAEIFEESGQPDSAYQYLAKYCSVRDSVFSDQVSSRIASLQAQYELQEQATRNQQLERDVRIRELELGREKTLRYFMTIIILLTLIILLVLIILYWNKSRDHRLIVQARDDLAREIEERKAVEKEREILIHEQQEALSKIKTLSGLIPICSNCKKIRNDQGYYEQLESYIMEHSDAVFSHGICPDCLKKLYPDFTKNRKKGGKTSK